MLPKTSMYMCTSFFCFFSNINKHLWHSTSPSSPDWFALAEGSRVCGILKQGELWLGHWMFGQELRNAALLSGCWCSDYKFHQQDGWAEDGYFSFNFEWQEPSLFINCIFSLWLTPLPRPRIHPLLRNIMQRGENILWKNTNKTDF